jgi:hypothetical protein
MFSGASTQNFYSMINIHIFEWCSNNNCYKKDENFLVLLLVNFWWAALFAANNLERLDINLMIFHQPKVFNTPINSSI